MYKGKNEMTFGINATASKSVWKRSEGSFAQFLRSPLFVREWENLAPIFASDGGFCRYMEKVQQRETTGIIR